MRHQRAPLIRLIREICEIRKNLSIKIKPFWESTVLYNMTRPVNETIHSFKGTPLSFPFNVTRPDSFIFPGGIPAGQDQAWP